METNPTKHAYAPLDPSITLSSLGSRRRRRTLDSRIKILTATASVSIFKRAQLSYTFSMLTCLFTTVLQLGRCNLLRITNLQSDPA